MRTHTRMLLGALTATLVLASAVGTASARNLSVSSSTFRINWSPISFSSGPGATGITLACRLTLEGSFHYTSVIKTPRALIGWVTKAMFERPCAGAGNWYADNGVESTGLAEGPRPNTLPWHVTYEAFTGRLPEITGLRLLFTLVYVVGIGLLCRYERNVQGVFNVNAGGEALSVTPDSTIPSTKISGGILCPSQGFVSASSSNVTVLSSAARITVRLI